MRHRAGVSAERIVLQHAGRDAEVVDVEHRWFGLSSEGLNCPTGSGGGPGSSTRERPGKGAPDENKVEDKMREGIWLGVNEWTEEIIIGTEL